jgi:hypothetical protein
MTPTDCDQEDDSIWVIGKENTVSLIPLDLPRTFPCLSFFQVGGPSHGPLGQVLEAYVCYRPDIGYVQGMSYLAAVMLLYMDTFPAFCCLANLLNSPILVHVLLSFKPSLSPDEPHTHTHTTHDTHMARRCASIGWI